MQSESLLDVFARRKEEIIQSCDLCGLCIEECQVIPFTPLASNSPYELQDKLLETLKDGSYSQEAYIRAFSCVHCGMCLDVCPQGLNPLHLAELLQVELAKQGHPRRAPVYMKLGNQKYLIADVLASLQIRPEEMRWLSQVPAAPPRKDIVVFLGCFGALFPHLLLTLADILERLKLDFVLLHGGELCCGQRHWTTNPEKADAEARALVAALSRFKPKKVLHWCAFCYYRMAYTYPDSIRIPFEMQEIFQFLSEHVDEMDFTRSVDKTVAVYDPCTWRLIDDHESVRRVLNAIPGLKVVETARNKDKALCCGIPVRRHFPEIGQALRREVLEDAAQTGADVLTYPCEACHLEFCPEEINYPFEMKHCITLLGEAMGISYEDRLKRFYLCGNPDKIMAEAKECIDASPFSFEEVADFVYHTFTRPQSPE